MSKIFKKSWIKRSIEDSKKRYNDSNILKVSFVLLTAFIVALMPVLAKDLDGYKLFILLFLGGLLSYVLLGIGLFVYSLLKPINRFRFGIAEIGEQEFFALEPYSREQSIGEVKVKFILPDNNIYEWKKVERKTFVGSVVSYFFDTPKEIELMEGVYRVKVKSSNWGEPYLLVADKKFLYENGKWGYVK